MVALRRGVAARRGAGDRAGPAWLRRTEAKPIDATRGLGGMVDDVRALLVALGWADRAVVNAAGWSRDASMTQADFWIGRPGVARRVQELPVGGGHSPASSGGIGSPSPSPSPAPLADWLQLRHLVLTPA
jgi:hypothetical protein